MSAKKAGRTYRSDDIRTFFTTLPDDLPAVAWPSLVFATSAGDPISHQLLMEEGLTQISVGGRVWVAEIGADGTSVQYSQLDGDVMPDELPYQPIFQDPKPGPNEMGPLHSSSAVTSEQLKPSLAPSVRAQKPVSTQAKFDEMNETATGGSSKRAPSSGRKLLEDKNGTPYPIDLSKHLVGFDRSKRRFWVAHNARKIQIDVQLDECGPQDFDFLFQHCFSWRQGKIPVGKNEDNSYYFKLIDMLTVYCINREPDPEQHPLI